MVLEGSLCENLDEVGTLMLRDKNLDHFDDVNGEDGFKLFQLCNIECLMLSHN